MGTAAWSLVVTLHSHPFRVGVTGGAGTWTTMERAGRLVKTDRVHIAFLQPGARDSPALHRRIQAAIDSLLPAPVTYRTT